MPLRLIAAALLLLMALSGCGSSSVPAQSEILRIPVRLDRGRLDRGVLFPQKATESTSLFLASLFHAGLVKFSPDLHVIPDLAVSIPTVSSSGRTYTFTIRQDARFPDGTPVTALDVVRSFSAALAGGSPLARRYLGGVEGAAAVESGEASALSGVTVIHRLTVRIRLSAPDSTFLQKLAFPPADIVRKGTSRPPEGLGPWRLGGRTAEGAFILLPRPHYHPHLALREIELVPVRDEAEALDLYRHGRLDVTWVPDGRFAALSTSGDFHASDALDAYYALPGRPYATLLAGSLNRDALGRALGPAFAPLASIVPPAVPDYVSSPPSLDPSAGAALPHVRLLGLQRGDARETTVARAVQNQWRGGVTPAIGVTLIHAAFMLPDPGRWLGVVLPATQSTWYRSLLQSAESLTNDPVTRMNDYSTGENWALEHAFVIPLASGRIAYLIKPAVGSIQVTPLGIMPENNNWALVTVT